MKELKSVYDKPDPDVPFYVYGDVLEDEEGSRWFCIAGAPHFVKAQNPENQTAWFISFDNIKVENGVATNIITEDDMAGLAYRLDYFISKITDAKDTYKFDFEKGKRGKFLQNILDYAHVDLSNLVLFRDSTWAFKVQEKTYESQSHSAFYNIVYQSNSTHEPLLWRAILDITQAGTKRIDCISVNGIKYNNWLYRNYKHYQTYNPSDIQMSEDEIGFGNTKWNSQWPITEDLMKLSDLKSQQMVNRYATDDKWVRLPYYLYGKHKEHLP